MDTIDTVLNNLSLSPSGIKSFENCHAGYIYSRIIFPRIETAHAGDVTNPGKKFHEMAEYAFREDIVAQSLAYEKETIQNDLKEFQNITEQRDYFHLPSVNEEYLEYEFEELGKLVGIPDKVVALPTGGYLVVDYKTSYALNWFTDRLQVTSYAYLLWKVKGFDPDMFEIAIDYVREDKLFRYRITKDDLIMHENYLKSRFMLVRKTVRNYHTHGDIKKIAHSPGECLLCPMNGACIVYQTWINPHYNPENPEMLPTIHLVREHAKLSELKSIYEERLKLIKRTLMFRYDNNSQEPGDAENRTFRDIIEAHMTKVQQYMTDYDAKTVIEHIIPLQARNMLKGLPLGEMVDTQALQTIVTDIILSFVPQRIKASALPDDVRKKVEQYKERKPKKPYLLMK